MINGMRVVILTLLAMVAFASNSLLCRLALRQTTIDAASFTLVRLLSGAIALWLMVITRKTGRTIAGNWTSALALFAYADGFSFAYVTLSAGTGALLLFGAVQATMILWGLRKGERLDARQWVGLAIALTGLVALVFPGLSAPPIGAASLMMGAGMAWGAYSLRGKGAGDSLSVTTGNFRRAIVFAALLSLAVLPWLKFDRAGTAYAILSGGIASGVGYVIWYSALPHLKATTAATVQLSVPVLAAVGGILFLSESITLRLLLASVLTLGGIGLVIIERPSG
jgi:drug/metabolite transporter (DMT)-like permease